MSVTLAQIQTDLKARLEADAYFADIPVIIESEQDFLAQLTKLTANMIAKAGKRGTAVVIGPTTVDVPSPEVPGPDWAPMKMFVTAYETPLLNKDPTAGTGKAAFEIARKIATVLHDYRAEGLFDNALCETAAIRPAAPLHGDQIAYSVGLRIPDKDTAADKVYVPIISPASGAAPQTLSITCATAGATIRYTLDGSYPAAGNATAVVYAAPIAVTSAATVRAVAAKSGMTDSNSSRAVIT
jgi:hypothetical protein